MHARLAFTVALLVLVTASLLVPLPAVASDQLLLPTAPLVPTGVEALVVPAPVVCELPDERTADSTVFLLADGSKKRVLFACPMFCQDDAGAWVDLDLSLIGNDLGQFTPRAAPFDLVIQSDAGGREPVRLEREGYFVGIDLENASQSAPVVRGDTATYANVTAATSLVYATALDGVKETIQLASVDAPHSFTFSLLHPGLDLRKDAGGEWVFHAANGNRPVFVMHDLEVFDSSADNAGEPAYCRSAAMRVDAQGGGSRVTCTVPDAWLNDPARVYPVQIDPTISGPTETYDTYLPSGYVRW